MEVNELRSKTFVGIIWKLLERSVAQIVSLVVSIVLARILDPDNYVSISIVAIFFTFANAIITGGLNTALIQKKNADQDDYSSVLCMTLVLSGIMYGILFVCAPLIASLYKRDELVAIIRVMGITLIINSVKSIFSAYVSKNLQFKKFFFSTLIGTLSSAVVGIALALYGFGPWALVAQQMTSSIIDTVVLFLVTGMRLPLRMSFERVRQLFRYGSGIFCATIVGAVYDEITPFVIGIKFTPASMAYYDKGKSFPSLINSACNDTLSAVLFPVIAKVQEQNELVLRFTRRFMRTASFLVFPIMIGFFCVAESFVEVVLSEKWLPSVAYIRIFCLAYLINFIQIGNLQAIKAIGRSDVFLKLEIIKKLIYTVVLVAFIFLSPSPVYIAAAAIVNSIVATVVNTYPNKKLIGYRYRYQVQDIAMNFISAVLMGAVVSTIGLLKMNAGVLLFIQIVAGIGVYCLLSYFMKNESAIYLFELLKSMKEKRND